MKIGRSTIRLVMEQAVERGMSLRDKDRIYEHLCIDEKSYQKHHRYGSILYDEDGTVIDVVEGRSKDSVRELFAGCLSPKQRMCVRTIAMDMLDTFINGAKTYLPNALICHDHYHLVTYLQDAVDKVRKREVKHQAELRKSKYLWLKDRMSFTDGERLRFDALSAAIYETSRAWHIKEMFREITFGGEYQYQNIQYWLWKMLARAKHIPEIDKVLNMFDSHDIGIMNAMRTGRNNGKAERRNGAIQELRTVGRGFYDFQHFRTTILFFHGGLKLC